MLRPDDLPVLSPQGAAGEAARRRTLAGYPEALVIKSPTREKHTQPQTPWWPHGDHYNDIQQEPLTFHMFLTINQQPNHVLKSAWC